MLKFADFWYLTIWPPKNAAMLAPDFVDATCKKLPNEQCGGMPGRGTNRVAHTSLLFLEYLRRSRRPGFILFLDLSKAFDRVVRQMVFRMGSSVGDAVRAVRDLHLPPDVSIQVERFVAEVGPITETMDVPAEVLRLVAALHSDTWFVLDSVSGKIVSTKLGSRQGCRFGGLVFNLLYASALAETKQECISEGLYVPIEVPQYSVPWQHSLAMDMPTHRYDLFDLTFVDDEAMYQIADSCDELLVKARALLVVLNRVLTRYGMQINWGPGKTEILMYMVGHRAKKGHCRA